MALMNGAQRKDSATYGSRHVEIVLDDQLILDIVHDTTFSRTDNEVPELSMNGCS
jgi:hypothetical protein